MLEVNLILLKIDISSLFFSKAFLSGSFFVPPPAPSTKKNTSQHLPFRWNPLFHLSSRIRPPNLPKGKHLKRRQASFLWARLPCSENSMRFFSDFCGPPRGIHAFQKLSWMLRGTCNMRFLGFTANIHWLYLPLLDFLHMHVGCRWSLLLSNQHCDPFWSEHPTLKPRPPGCDHWNQNHLAKNYHKSGFPSNKLRFSQVQHLVRYHVGQSSEWPQ